MATRKARSTTATVEAFGPAFLPIEVVSLSSLIPSARNARIHDAAQIAEIKRSMLEHGWTIPVLIDEAGGVLAGHGRLQAAEQLGWIRVPIVRAIGWTEEQKRLYILKDNKLTERGGWDWEKVSKELKELSEVDGLDLTLSGFEQFEIDPLIAANWTPPDKTPASEPDEEKQKPHGATDGRAITVTIEQYERIKPAVEKVRELAHDPDMSEGKALEVVAQAYVSAGVSA